MLMESLDGCHENHFRLSLYTLKAFGDHVGANFQFSSDNFYIFPVYSTNFLPTIFIILWFIFASALFIKTSLKLKLKPDECTKQTNLLPNQWKEKFVYVKQRRIQFYWKWNILSVRFTLAIFPCFFFLHSFKIFAVLLCVQSHVWYKVQTNAHSE